MVLGYFVFFLNSGFIVLSNLWNIICNSLDFYIWNIYLISYLCLLKVYFLKCFIVYFSICVAFCQHKYSHLVYISVHFLSSVQLLTLQHLSFIWIALSMATWMGAEIPFVYSISVTSQHSQKIKGKGLIIFNIDDINFFQALECGMAINCDVAERHICNLSILQIFVRTVSSVPYTTKHYNYLITTPHYLSTSTTLRVG